MLSKHELHASSAFSIVSVDASGCQLPYRETYSHQVINTDNYRSPLALAHTPRRTGAQALAPPGRGRSVLVRKCWCVPVAPLCKRSRTSDRLVSKGSVSRAPGRCRQAPGKAGVSLPAARVAAAHATQQPVTLVVRKGEEPETPPSCARRAAWQTSKSDRGKEYRCWRKARQVQGTAVALLPVRVLGAGEAWAGNEEASSKETSQCARNRTKTVLSCESAAVPKGKKTRSWGGQCACTACTAGRTNTLLPQLADTWLHVPAASTPQNPSQTT